MFDFLSARVLSVGPIRPAQQLRYSSVVEKNPDADQLSSWSIDLFSLWVFREGCCQQCCDYILLEYKKWKERNSICFFNELFVITFHHTIDAHLGNAWTVALKNFEESGRVVDPFRSFRNGPTVGWRWRFSFGRGEICWSTLNRYFIDTYWSENVGLAQLICIYLYGIIIRLIIWIQFIRKTSAIISSSSLSVLTLRGSNGFNRKRPRPAIYSTALLSPTRSGISEKQKCLADVVIVRGPWPGSHWIN